ncbi:hypothetical protein I7I50_01292 [Histoplasma capsulatum G186AR]|uniref:Uncharacterized protein n=1 Tax=Ajellomyces capsulatus TaxID=5037 RepID=A0A8H7Z079_AJECA|nr:hypothetical protein I7I52_08881 [Histoplasma capsulatum]QSS73209.1 hypothetical protein I7I50_01292 [Histoplasma capsulatum G186AR]
MHIPTLYWKWSTARRSHYFQFLPQRKALNLVMWKTYQFELTPLFKETNLHRFQMSQDTVEARV